MAEQIVSPGVFQRENDQSFITQQPIEVGAAIIGPTVKGPVEIPTIVTSYSDYKNKFGAAFTSGSDTYSYFTSIAAYNYFNNGGTSLLVARVVSGSYTSATSSISSSAGAPNVNAFELETISEGEIMNSFSTEVSGALPSGSEDNLRWEISQADTGSGTFTLLVRQGNDTSNSKTILETWAGLSLDPKSSNYIARVIGDRKQTLTSSGGTYYVQDSGSFPNASRYVRIKAVNNPTPDYFDNNGVAKSNYTASIPIVSSGSFGGATGGVKAGAKFYNSIDANDSQGLIGDNYDNVINLLSNKDDYKYNIISAPGLYRADYSSQISTLISNTQNRGDAIFVADLVKYNSTVTSVKSQAQSVDNSFVASYWPWVQVSDPELGKQVWVPASTMIPGVYAFNDNTAAEWFAPAGFNRGGLSTVLRAERKLSSTDRDSLYQGKVNPIATFPGQGIVIFGQKTLQTKSSALDRVNVRRLLIALKDFIGQVANNLVFEQNTIATRNSFLSQVNPFLEAVQARQGLYSFRVVMDETNNTPDVIDRNQLVGQIFIQPTRTAEYIILDFNILPTGAEFPQ